MEWSAGNPTMIPMCIEEFWFGAEIPAEEKLLEHLRAELGADARARFDEISVRGDRVQLTSQDVIALIYAAKVCQRLGGAAVAPGTTEKGRVPIPPWAEVPWNTHSWFERLKIKWGRISFARVPLDE